MNGSLNTEGLEGTKFLKQLNTFETLTTSHMETNLLPRLILTAT